MKTVLVIDDDPKLAALLAEYLGGRGFRVKTAEEGTSGLKKIAIADCVVLDVMMPGMTGFDVLREIRKESSIPVIMLTARGEDTDRIVGLEMGADDYLAKPFNPRELLARINAVLRRSAANIDNTSRTVIESAGITFMPERREVKVDGKPLRLTTTEYDILLALVKAAGRVIPRDRLMEMARGEDWSSFDRSIDVHISNLRRKLNDDPKQPSRIKTIRGIGYLVPDQ